MKYLINAFVGFSIIFMFVMNLIAVSVLWDEIPRIISIIWLSGTLLSFFIGFAHFEALVNEVKEGFILIAKDLENE